MCICVVDSMSILYGHAGYSEKTVIDGKCQTESATSIWDSLVGHPEAEDAPVMKQSTEVLLLTHAKKPILKHG